MSFWGPRIERYRWEDYEHDTLYDFVRNGRGATAVEGADQAWTEFTALLVESKATIDKAVRDAGAEWHGQAAESARAGVSPLTAWAEDAASAGEASRTSLQDVARAFAHTAHAMPEPVVVPSNASWGVPAAFGELLDGQQDEDVIARQAQQAHLHAIELMTAYNLNNIDSAATTGTFDAPPEIGVTAEDASPPTGSRSHVIVTPTARDDSAEPLSGQQEPPGSSEPQPGPAGPAPRPGDELRVDPADVTVLPATVTGSPIVTGSPTPPATGSVAGGTSPASGNPVPPVTGALPSAGLSGGGLSGGGGRVERSPDAVDRLVAGERAGLVAGEHASRGGTSAGRGVSTAFGPVAGGRRDEDQERTSPDYLRDFHDEYWDDTPPVFPPVIGEGDD